MRDFDPIAGLGERLLARPDADALIAADSRLTVAELCDSAARFGRMLADRGVGEGTVVGVSAPPLMQPVFAVALWMIGAVGAVAPHAEGDESARVLDLLVTTSPRPDFPAERQVVIDATWMTRSAALESRQWESLAPRGMGRPAGALVRLVFSSGTTGAPKAIPFTVEEIGERVRRGREFWMHPRPFLAILGLGTVSGSATFFSALDEGTPYLISGSADESVRLLAATATEAVHASPVQLADLLALARRRGETLPALRWIQSAGSPLPEQLARGLAGHFGAEVEVVYGSTEVGAITIRRGPPLAPGDVGEILPFATVEILDDSGRPRADGQDGTIRIRRPLQAHRVFRPASGDAEVLNGGWFVPGDIGRVLDGHLILLGRRDELINAAGVKIDPERIEQRARRYPGVSDAVAFGVHDSQGVAAVALAVVADPAVALPALHARLRTELGDAAPRILERIETVPRTENGKIRRGEVASALRGRLERSREL